MKTGIGTGITYTQGDWPDRERSVLCVGIHLLVPLLNIHGLAREQGWAGGSWWRLLDRNIEDAVGLQLAACG